MSLACQSAALMILALISAPGPASAQSLTPMRGEVRSFTESFALRVSPGNPYTHRIRIEIKVYDEAFNPVAARVSPSEIIVGAQNRRSVLVVVPFQELRERRVRICAESIPFPNQATKLRTQVCGKFLAHRVL